MDGDGEDGELFGLKGDGIGGGIFQLPNLVEGY